MQRCRAIVHLVDASSAPIAGRDLLADFDAINRELYMFDRGLAEKSQVIAANKIDVPEARIAAEEFAAALGKRGLHVHLMSGATGEGVDKLVDAMVRALEGAPLPSPFDHEALERELAAERARDAGEDGEEQMLKPEDFAEDDSLSDKPAHLSDKSPRLSDKREDEPQTAPAKSPAAKAARPERAASRDADPLLEALVDEREEAKAEKEKRAPALTGRRKDGMFKEKAARSEQPLGNKFRPTSEAAAALLAAAARADGDGKRVIPKVREAKAPPGRARRPTHAELDELPKAKVKPWSTRRPACATRPPKPRPTRTRSRRPRRRDPPAQQAPLGQGAAQAQRMSRRRPPRAWIGAPRPVNPAELLGPRGLTQELLEEPEDLGERPDGGAGELVSAAGQSEAGDAPALSALDAFHRSLLSEQRLARIECGRSPRGSPR